MKRPIKIVIVAFIVLGFLFGGGAVLYKLAKGRLISFLEKLTDQEVTYTDYSFNPLKGLILTDLKVGELFQAETLKISYDFGSILKREVAKVYIEGLHFNTRYIPRSSEGEGRETEKEIGDNAVVFLVNSVEIKRGEIIHSGAEFPFDYLFADFKLMQNGIISEINILRPQILGERIDTLKGKLSFQNGELYIRDIEAIDTTISFRYGKLKLIDDVLLGDISNFTYREIFLFDSGQFRFNLNTSVLKFKGDMVEFSKKRFKSVELEVNLKDISHPIIKRGILLDEKGGKVSGSGEIEELDSGLENATYRFDLNLKGYIYPEGPLKDVKSWGRLRTDGTLMSFTIRWDLDSLYYIGKRWGNTEGIAHIYQDSVYIDSLFVREERGKMDINGVIKKKSYFFKFNIYTYDLSLLPVDFLPSIEGKFKIYGSINYSSETDVPVVSLECTAEDVKFSVFTADTVRLSIGKYNDYSLDITAFSGKIGNFTYDSLQLGTSIERFKKNPYILTGFHRDNSLQLEGIWREEEGLFRIDNHLIRSQFNGTKTERRDSMFLEVSSSLYKFNIPRLDFWKGRISNIRGIYDKNLDTLGLSCIFEDISLEALKDFLPSLERTGGSLNGEIKLSGTLHSPTVDLQADVEDIVINELAGENLGLEVNYSGGRLVIDKLTFSDSIERVSISASIPLIFSFTPFEIGFIREDSLEGYIESEGVPALVFEKLYSPLFICEETEIRGNLKLGGTPYTPLFYGTLYFEGKNGALTATKMPFRKLIGYGTLEGARVSVDSIMITQEEGGEVLGSGIITLKGFNLDSIDLTFSLDKVKSYPDPYVEGDLSGNLVVAGNFPDIYVRGDVDIEDAVILVPFGVEREKTTPSPTPLMYLIRVKGEKGIYLINQMAEIEFSADMELRKEDELNTTATGVLKTIGGRLMYLENVFTITEGEIIFQNIREIDPLLNLIGETTIDDTIKIRLYITGTLTTPQVRLESEPAMEEDDIISYLTFGVALNELPESAKEELIGRKALTLAELVASRELRRVLRLSELELNIGVAGGDPGFTVGFYLSPEIYLRYTHDIQAFEKDVFLLNYILTKNTAIYAQRDREGEVAIGLQLQVRF